MPARYDILEQRDSFKGPFAQSVLVHAAVAGALVLSTISFEHSHESFGSTSTQNGSAVPVTAVKAIPLPSRPGPVNPVANDTDQLVPQKPVVQPKKQAKPQPEKAIPLLQKKRKIDTSPLQEPSEQRYLAQPLQQNQLTSQHAPAAVSPMFQKPGSGGVGLGQNSILGNEFGAYADLVIRRVTDKWQTNGLAGLHTAPIAIVTFDIQRDGSVRNIRVAQGSGIATLDVSAQRAVQDAAPFPPLPPQYGRSEAGVELRFQLQR
jgi:protein TonB